VRERPVVADMDQDGIDDFGLWVPDRAGATPEEASEWYILVSGGNPWFIDGPDADALPNEPNPIHFEVDPISGWWKRDFTPIPFGEDIYFQYGDEFAIPLLGNFDPPVAPDSPGPPVMGDLTGDGLVNQFDLAAWIPHAFSAVGSPSYALKYDLNTDTFVNQFDLALLVSRLFQPATSGGLAPSSGAEGGAESSAGAVSSTVLTQEVSTEAAVLPAAQDAVLEADAVDAVLASSTSDVDVLAAAGVADFRWTWSETASAKASGKSARAADEALALYGG
jgi:hypothetical protein